MTALITVYFNHQYLSLSPLSPVPVKVLRNQSGLSFHQTASLDSVELQIKIGNHSNISSFFNFSINTILMEKSHAFGTIYIMYIYTFIRKKFILENQFSQTFTE